MCKICARFVRKAVRLGHSLQTANDLLWNFTAYPFEHPTEEMIDKLLGMAKKKRKTMLK